jgi:hypothetical protein
MDTNFKALVGRAAHDVCAALANVWPGQYGAVEQGGETVVGDDRGSLHFGKKPLAEHAPDRAPGVIWSEAEQKRRANVVFFEERKQAWHAFARPFEGINVDLECEEFFHEEGVNLRRNGSKSATRTWQKAW